MKQGLKRFFMRRNLLVNRGLQRTLFLQSIVATSLVLLLAATALTAPLVLELQTVTSDSWEHGEGALLLLYLHDNLLPVAVVTLVVAGLLSLRSSHKIAGPLYRLTEVFRRIRIGSLPGPVRTRKGDFLKQEVAIVNDMLDGLRERAAGIHGAKSELLTAIRRPRRMASLG